MKRDILFRNILENSIKNNYLYPVKTKSITYCHNNILSDIKFKPSISIWSDPTGLYELDSKGNIIPTNDDEQTILAEYYKKYNGEGNFFNGVIAALEEAGHGLEMVHLDEIVVMGESSKSEDLANINSQISDVVNNLQVRNEYIVSESTAKAYERAYHQWSPSAGGLGNSFAYGGSMLLPEISFARGASYLAQGYKVWSATRVSGLASRAINYSDEAYRITQYPRSPVTGRFVEGKQSFLSYGRGSVPLLAPSPMRLGVGYTYGLNGNASVATKWGVAIGGSTASQVSLYLYYQKLFKISK